MKDTNTVFFYYFNWRNRLSYITAKNWKYIFTKIVYLKLSKRVLKYLSICHEIILKKISYEILFYLYDELDVNLRYFT